MESRDATRRAQRTLRGHKAPDRALVMTVVGLALLVPPFANIFQLDLRIGGVPFTAVYLFGLWAALIIGAALLSPRLKAQDQVSVGAESGAEPGAQPGAEPGADLGEDP